MTNDSLDTLVTHHIQAARVRVYLGHGYGSRQVRVSRDGDVTYYGSTDGFDRQHDYWHEGGCLVDVYADALGGLEPDAEEAIQEAHEAGRHTGPNRRDDDCLACYRASAEEAEVRAGL